MHRPPPEGRTTAARRRLGAALALACLLAAGCRTVPRQTATVVDRGAPPPPEVSAPAPAAPLDRGEELLAGGDPVAAAAAYEAHLAAGDGVAGGDLALFRLALLRLDAASPLHDPEAGVRLLRRLVAAHPVSPYATPASLILELRTDNRRLDSEVTRLRDQLEELRRIDLGGG